MSPAARVTLNQLNAMDQLGFESILHGVVENSPWVIRNAWRKRPFADFSDLVKGLCATINDADQHLQLELLRAHPELAGREAITGTMTEESTGEQSRLRLNALSSADYEMLNSVNRHYRERFGFPLIIALRVHNNLESVLQAAKQRLKHDRSTELRLAMHQVGLVIQGRLERLLEVNAPATC